MRILVTGGTGYIGSDVVRLLANGGHDVTALVRSEASGARASALGARPMSGDLQDLPRRAAELEAFDAFVHLAYDPRGGDDAAAGDRAAIEAFRAAARSGGVRRAIVYTSNVHLLAREDGEAVDEASPFPPGLLANPCSDARWRPEHERIVLDATSDGAAAVVRVGAVYGGPDENVGSFFATARTEGAAAYVGSGANRWSLVQRRDLARLYAAIVEQRASGVFHGVDGAFVRVIDAARAASLAAGAAGRIRSVSLEDARVELGKFADVKCLDVAAKNGRAAALGWRPTNRSFLHATVEAYDQWRAAVHE